MDFKGVFRAFMFLGCFFWVVFDGFLNGVF